MSSSSWPPRSLPVDDAATWWSVPPPEVAPALEERPLVVLLHGLGSHERDLPGLVPFLPPGPLYASLRAPLPVSGLGGRAWFAPRTGQRVQPDAAAADAAARGVLAWLERTHARVRTPGPVALLGFSQGGALAVQLLRHSPESFACAVVLSGFLAAGLVAGDEALAQIRPPTLWSHDPTDPVVPEVDADRLRAFLTGHVALTEHRHTAGHGVDAAGLADTASFLSENLPQR